jgi:hypothetical protein
MIHITIEQLTFGLLCRCKGRVVFRFSVPRDTTAPPPKAHHFRRCIHEDPDVIQTIETEQFTTLSVVFLDDKKKPAKVDGVPAWATDNSDLLTIEPAADGMSCKVTTGIMPSTPSLNPKVKVSADADLGTGVALIEGVTEFVIQSRPATTVELSATPPQDTPDTPPTPPPPAPPVGP